jgi:AcrR family transcriptional regulator
MTQVTRTRPRGAGKAQLHDTALRMFAQHGVEGTSLQAIADDMGVTKAAVYYHYKTKDELVLGVIAPLFEQLDAIIDKAEAHSGRAARLEEFITGLVDLVLEGRSRYSMVISDPYVARLLDRHPARQDWASRIFAIAVGPNPDPAARIPFLIFTGGLTAPLTQPSIAALDNSALREHFLDSARRLLRLRRRPATGPE